MSQLEAETSKALQEEPLPSGEFYFVHFKEPQDVILYMRLATDDYTTDDLLWGVAEGIRALRESLAWLEVVNRAEFWESVEKRIAMLDKGWR